MERVLKCDSGSSLFSRWQAAAVLKHWHLLDKQKAPQLFNINPGVVFEKHLEFHPETSSDWFYLTVFQGKAIGE